MAPDEARHMAFTGIRAKAYEELFGDKPVAVFQSHKLRGESDGPYLIDVFVYSMNLEGDDRPIYAAVTNGMSDQRMVEGDSSDQPRRRELIQYLNRRAMADWPLQRSTVDPPPAYDPKRHRLRAPA